MYVHGFGSQLVTFLKDNLLVQIQNIEICFVIHALDPGCRIKEK